jgi:hypothetical protein
VGVAEVCYHFLCPAHGRFGSAAIEDRLAPPPRQCPVCSLTSEVWVGTSRQVSEELASSRDTSMLQTG